MDERLIRLITWLIAAAIFLLGVAAGSAIAEPLTVKWTINTTRADGSPYPASERAGTKIYYQLPGQSKKIRNVRSPTATSVTIDVPPGTYTVTATHYDTGGRESKPSAAVTKVVLPKAPAPPLNVR